MRFRCDPFRNVKEPECLFKWLLLRMEVMVQSYQATLQHYKQLAPLQERIFKYMKREMDDMDESERWKQGDDEDDEPSPQTPMGG
jgi:hypothetical protein